jgi:ferric-dicitrate binding protein FerR (iron transport regulator)
MSQELFWVLLSKKLAGEASSHELKDLENLILEHPEWQYAIQNLEDLWKHEPLGTTIQEEDAYMLHLHRMSEQNIPFGDRPVEEMPARSTRRMSNWYWAAAAAVLATGSFLVIQYFNDSTDNSQQAIKEHNEISTRPGSKSRIQLPDGTIVMLNAGSKLAYNKDFGKGIREVTLTGEAFFDVKKMKSVPFVIHTTSIDIKVLGTVFNVKAYPEDKKTETSLIRGSIEVTIKNRPNDKIILSPSEKLVVEQNEVAEEPRAVANKKEVQPSVNTLMSVNKLKYESDSTVAETLWIENKLVFRDESFEDLAVKLERWYSIELEIADKSLQRRRFSGIFENETIEQALEALKMTVPFKHEQTGNKIIIHR